MSVWYMQELKHVFVSMPTGENGIIGVVLMTTDTQSEKNGQD